MNSVANGRLRREGPFDELWIQPLAQDNGLSLGAALLSHLGRPESTPRWRMRTAFLGSQLDVQRGLDVARDAGLVARTPDNLSAEVAARLAAGDLVAWVRGRAEVGSRALGGRSLLADPRSEAIRDEINARVKLREDWRPFAPVVLAEDASELFIDGRASPFMMFASPARRTDGMVGALHIDGSGRVQTVSQEDDAGLHALLCAFKATTGVGCLLNTSLNSRGEPIVRTVDDAIELFCESGIDLLVVEDTVLEAPPDADSPAARASPPPPRIVLGDLEPVLADVDSLTVLNLGPAELRDAVSIEIGVRRFRTFTPSVSVEFASIGELAWTEGERSCHWGDLPTGTLVVLLPISVDLADELLSQVVRQLEMRVAEGCNEVWLLDGWRGLRRLTLRGGEV